jgi:hypothetical protein
MRTPYESGDAVSATLVALMRVLLEALAAVELRLWVKAALGALSTLRLPQEEWLRVRAAAVARAPGRFRGAAIAVAAPAFTAAALACRAEAPGAPSALPPTPGAGALRERAPSLLLVRASAAAADARASAITQQEETQAGFVHESLDMQTAHTLHSPCFDSQALKSTGRRHMSCGGCVTHLIALSPCHWLWGLPAFPQQRTASRRLPFLQMPSSSQL